MKKVWLFSDYSQAEARVVAWAGPIPAMKTWFLTGEDIHLNVAKLIGKVVEDNKIQMPRKLWMRKPWQELSKSIKEDNEGERQIAKNTVHGNNYDMGRVKFSIVTGLPLKHAQIVQNIYHSIFPEIRGNYHVWIKQQLQSTRTLVNPWNWKRTFYGYYDAEMERAGYAWFPQSTIGLLNIYLLTRCCEFFSKGAPEVHIVTPESIRNRGLDVQLQVHDAVGIVLPDDKMLIRDTVKKMKEIGEKVLIVRGEELIIPMDFKVGPSWGELKDYKLEEIT